MRPMRTAYEWRCIVCAETLWSLSKPPQAGALLQRVPTCRCGKPTRATGATKLVLPAMRSATRLL